MRNILLGVGLFAVGVAAFTGVLYVLDERAPGSNIDTNSISGLYDIKSLDYSLDEFSNGLCSDLEGPACDNSLIFRTSDSDESVVIENVSDLFRQGGYEPSTWNINKLYFPENSDVLIFQAFKPHTDAGGRFYTFDLSNRTFRKLINDYEYWSGDILSPDKSKFTKVSADGKSLYVIDLLQDEKVLIAELDNNESLVAYIGEFAGSPTANISWVSEQVIEYGVYDEGEPLQIAVPRKLLDTRQIEL